MHARSSPRKAMPAPSGGHTAGFVAAVVANVALAFGPMFVRLTDTGPVAAAFWRMALALPLLCAAAWMARNRTVRMPLSWRSGLLLAGAGAGLLMGRSYQLDPRHLVGDLKLVWVSLTDSKTTASE